MTHRKPHARFAGLCALVVLGVGPVRSSLAQAPDGLPAGARVHALLAFDTNSTPPLVGLDVDETHMVAALTGGISSPGRLNLQVFKGDDVTPERIVAYLQNLAVGPDDTLLFYYTGHGATHPKYGHGLTLACGRVLVRSVLRDAMKQKNPRLNVLLTDCCSTLIELPRSRVVPAPSAPAREPLSAALRCLLFQHQGIVDITSSSYDPARQYGESSVTLESTGGFFTAVLTDALANARFDELDVDPKDGFLDWREFFPAVRESTRRVYREFKAAILANPPQGAKDEDLDGMRKQTDQTPQAFSLGVRYDETSPVQKLRDLFAPGLGIAFELVPFYGDTLGARLTAPPATGSPAASIHLEPGDMIVSLDGLPIRGPDDLQNHYARTPLVFVNVRTAGAQGAEVVLPATAPPAERPRYVLGVMSRSVVLDPAKRPQVVGLQITQVFAGSPAERAGLAVGETILAVNGAGTTTPKALSSALAASNGRVLLTVRSAYLHRQTRTVEIDLQPAGAEPAGAAPPAPAVRAPE